MRPADCPGMISDQFMLTLAVDIAKFFELAGIAVVVVGAIFALVKFGLNVTGLRRTEKLAGDRDAVSSFRKTLGRSILTGLEFLVAGDIIRTVAIEPTLDNALVLGLIVLIRTFLSFSLEVEIDGRWPWQKVAAEKD